ncbi:MAG: DUF3488 and transglutaminase-like domain-containing protein [Proteobacteria bacterium]|nr:DUF3488 and transglutaminase-like domain-containing protein [Pseudomonadota bacterium]
MTPSPGLRRLMTTCGALTVALLPHVARLPPWISATFALAVLWRLLAEQRAYALPSRALRVVAALAAVLAVLANYRTLNGLEAGTALLCLMAALKLGETRAARDHAVLVFVGYLLCLATLLHQESLPRLCFVLLAVWLLTAALARAHRPLEASSSTHPLRLAARLLGLGLPLAALLFVFVPRLEGHFWALPTLRDTALTGIGDDMTPGDIASLARSDEPAFRAWFEAAVPSPPQRYWRVQVLESFDGRGWHRGATRADASAPPVAADGARYDYRVALEATHRPWLVGLDTVLDWPQTLARRNRAGVLMRLGRGPRELQDLDSRFEYALSSAPSARVMPDGLPEDLAQRNVELPPGRAPATRALAARLRGASSSEHAYIDAVLRRFHDEAYEYTLEPPRLGTEPTDEFMFGTRQGFCEHYAAAFAVMMRAVGIPARVVIGYQGGDWNRYGGYLLVRQSSAHAWNEVWLSGEGWRRVDPTAAVAPERVRQGDGGPADAHDGVGVLADWAWLGRARQLWDAARTAWYEGVINFSAKSQQRLLDALGLGAWGLRGLALALTAGFMLTALLLGGWLAWELRPAHTDPLQRAWAAVCTSLAAAGLPRAPAEGPLDYARRVAQAAPALGDAMQTFATAYVRARYLPYAVAGDLREVQRLARRLRLQARKASR